MARTRLVFTRSRAGTSARLLALGLIISAGLLLPVAEPAIAADPQHALAIRGEPAHPAGFTHFDAVNPDAPKGGRLLIGSLGSFDSTNPFIIKGTPVDGVIATGNVIESLMARGLDEPFTLYGLLAETVEVPADRSEIIFNLDPRAKFSDGRPVTAADVLFSFDVLREKGRPNHRAYYKKVSKAERLSDRKVRFVFDQSGDRELPLILGLMPVLPAHVFKAETFETTSLEPMIGSGPYKMAAIDPGRSVSYQRDPGYWGRDLPVMRGRYNFDELRFDYFRDDTTMFEAFKAGELDARVEDGASNWFQGYNVAAVRNGSIVKSEFATAQPAGMTALVFNTRRPVFANPAVRSALIQAFDFEFANQTLFAGLYRRTQSFFERSTLSSVGRPADDEERRLLSPFPGAVKPAILDGSYRLPRTDGTGRNRDNLRVALETLKAAGYAPHGGKMVESATGKPLAFEALVNSAGQQRVLMGFKADLERIGITLSIRQVDSAQYQARLRTFDYDMIQYQWPQSLSPGNEQTYRWVETAQGSYNFAGIDSPAVRAMIDAMLTARAPDAFTSAVRALDRVLRSGDYVIPLYHVPNDWVAHAARIRIPPKEPVTGLTVDTWWSQSK